MNAHAHREPTNIADERQKRGLPRRDGQIVRMSRRMAWRRYRRALPWRPWLETATITLLVALALVGLAALVIA